MKHELKKFIIVGTQRTGSSALAESLSFHPSIVCGWEWTQRAKLGAKISIAKQALAGDFSRLSQEDQVYVSSQLSDATHWLGYRRLFRSSNKWLIHPRFSPALWADQFEAHLSWFARDSSIRIIHIVRRDNVAWLKSKYVADKLKSFHGKTYPPGTKVSVPVAEAVKRLKAKRWVDERLAAAVESARYLRIDYEDFESDPDESVARLLCFLDCDHNLYEKKERYLKKQSQKPADEYIENWTQLVGVLEKNSLLDAEHDLR